MKARRKSDGKIIEVETYMLNSRRGKDGSWESSYKDIKSGLVYEASELLFNLDYYTVIDGWVARSNDGPNDLGLRVYTVKPDRRKNHNGWCGHGEMSYLIDSRLFPDLAWSDEPQEIKIIFKKKEEMKPIRKGDVVSIKGKDCELKGVVTELTDEKHVKVQPFNIQCDLYIERKIIIQDNNEIYG